MPGKYASGKLQFPYPGGLGTSAFSLECLVYLRSLADNQYLFHLQASGGSGVYTLLMVTTSGVLQAWTAGGNSQTSTNTLSLNRWYRIVATCKNVLNDMVWRFWIDETECGYTGTNTLLSAANHGGDVNVGGRSFDTARSVLSNGMIHRARVYNTVLDPTHIQTRGLDLLTQYAANRAFRADLDNNLNGIDSTGAATTGTATNCTLQSWPTTKTRLCGWYRPSDAGNSVTASRFTTLADLSGCGNDITEVSSSGPRQVTNAGLGIVHAYFDGTSNYLQKAAGAILSNQRHTVVAFAGLYNTHTNANRVLACVGTLATANSEVLSLGAKANTGQPLASLNGVDVATHTLAHSCTPRMIAYSANDVDGAIQTDNRWEEAPIDEPPDTDDDLRVGGAMATTPTEWFHGQLYEMLIFQESYIADGDLDDLYELGKTRGYYTDAEKMVVFEGSSTVYGTASTYGQNLPALCSSELSDCVVLNYGNGGESLSHFTSGYAAQGGSTAATGWFDKADRFFVIQPFGNDYIGTGTDGYGGTTTYDTVLAGYQTFVTTTVGADYARVGHWEAIARGSVGAGVVDDTNIAARERARQRIFGDLTGVYRFNFDSIAGLAVTQSGVDATLATNVHTITTGGNYAGDEVHLDDDGFALLVTQFGLRVDGLFASGPARLSRGRYGRYR